MQTGKKIRCLVIDDEPPARVILKEHISQVESLELAGDCSNAVEAVAFLQQHPVDLLFLDIQMPHILGTSFIRTLKNPPKVIFTTAFRKYAVEGFDLNAVDYLLKPIGFERFLQAVNKVLQTNIAVPGINTQASESIPEKAYPFLYFRVDRKMIKIFLDDILFLESMKDYIRIFTKTKMIITKQPISSLEELLPAEAFIRIHRSYIVAIDKIDSFSSDTIEISKKELPIGRIYKNEVVKLLGTVSVNPAAGPHPKNYSNNGNKEKENPE
jgi:DNA-binding LytR/AlgR family response regulator